MTRPSGNSPVAVVHLSSKSAGAGGSGNLQNRIKSDAVTVGAGFFGRGFEWTFYLKHGWMECNSGDHMRLAMVHVMEVRNALIHSEFHRMASHSRRHKLR